MCRFEQGDGLVKFERLFILATICISAGAGLTAMDEGDAPTTADGSHAVGIIYKALTYGLILFFFYLHRRVTLPNLRRLLVTLPISLLAIASSFWSLLPGWTFRRGVDLSVATVFGYLLGTTFTSAGLHRLYARAFEVMVFLSVIVLALLPSYGVSHGAHSGDWRGAFYHKNAAGSVMAMAFMTFALVPPALFTPRRRWTLVALSSLLLYKADASTGFVAVIVVIAAQAVWSLFMLKRKALVGSILATYPLVVLGSFLYVKYANAVFHIFGKSTSFSGRDRLWAGVIDAISLRPLLGYGYASFWDPAGGQLFLIQERSPFVPGSAHNGFLNLMLHLGIVGLLLFAIFYLQSMWLTIREGRRTRETQARWFFSFMIICVLLNLTEARLIDSLTQMWTTLVAFYVAFSIERANRNQVEFLEIPAHEPAAIVA